MILPCIADRSERVAVVARQSPLASLDKVEIEGLGEDKLALSLQQRAHIVDRSERVKVVGPQSPLGPFESAGRTMDSARTSLP